MSKKNKNTSTLILEKARKMYNERGIEYVSLRELAKVLNIRVSNITYYFPTKDDLVNALSNELNQMNSEILVDKNVNSIKTFLGWMKLVFKNQMRYRCLMLSIVQLMEQNKVISKKHKQTQRDRNNVLMANIQSFISVGLLKFNNTNEMEHLVYTITLIARFWVSEATISFRQMNGEKQIAHYLSIIAYTLLPYASETGKIEIEDFLNSNE